MLSSSSASPAEARKNRAIRAKQYAARPVAQASSKGPAVDLRLRRIAMRVMEELKSPTAIPSAILMAALEEAKSLR